MLSDRILVKVTARPGESFLDKMIALVEGSSRQKTPNEIALTILLAGFTLVFVIVCATLKPFADYVGANITVAAFISLFVCLIPTTIGGLLSAIGIAGMDRALRANVITKSGKAVETAGDIDTLLLDKTGTITIGNRKATRFHPAEGTDPKAFVRMCVLSSEADPTPEGKSHRGAGRRRRGPHRPGGDGRRADGEIHRRNQVFGRRHARRTPHPQGEPPKRSCASPPNTKIPARPESQPPCAPSPKTAARRS